jgi:porphobilinogen deaminase
LKSQNLEILTPLAGRGAIYPEVRYRDANLFVALWRGLQASASYQVTRERVFLGEMAENRRVQLTVAYYF